MDSSRGAFESIPVMDGYGFFAKNLEYSSSKSVGAELGMLMASKQAVEAKRRPRPNASCGTKTRRTGRSRPRSSRCLRAAFRMKPDIAAKRRRSDPSSGSYFT